MSSIERNITYQDHDGSGDNVAGDKIVKLYQSIVPKTLQKPIELILSDIREKNPHLAKIRLETIKAQGTLDADSVFILNGLLFHLGLLEEKDKKNLFNSLITFLKTPSDTLTCDLCLTTLIRLEVENNQNDDARERYLKIEKPGPYSQEAFYELVATADELQGAYEKNKINLCESELNGLVRGFFRTENLPLALKVANRLNDVFPSFNSRVLVLIAKGTTLINEQLQGTYYWTITATLKAELIEIIEEIVLLINESNGQDKRLFNIAIPSLQYMLDDHKGLRDICWKYVDQFEETHPEVAAQLHNIYAKDSSKIKDVFVHDYAKAKEDKEYREQLLNNLAVAARFYKMQFSHLSDFSCSQ